MVWMQRRTSKYSAKRTVYGDRRYDSKLEATVAAELDLELRAGTVAKVEPQKTFELRVEGRIVARHRVDFLVTMPDGSQKVVEAKGFATEVWRIKRELFIALFPWIDYEVRTARPRWPARRMRRAS